MSETQKQSQKPITTGSELSEELGCAARSREEWVERCAKYFREKAAMDSGSAREYAEACYCADPDNDERPPEQCAAEELEEWASNSDL